MMWTFRVPYRNPGGYWSAPARPDPHPALADGAGGGRADDRHEQRERISPVPRRDVERDLGLRDVGAGDHRGLRPREGCADYSPAYQRTSWPAARRCIAMPVSGLKCPSNGMVTNKMFMGVCFPHRIFVLMVLYASLACLPEARLRRWNREYHEHHRTHALHGAAGRAETAHPCGSI